MDDFGGTNGVFGDMDNVAERVKIVTNDSDASSLAGTGISMEGIDQNPVYYELVLDSLWQKSDGRSIDAVRDFIIDFGVRRCGKRLPKRKRHRARAPILYQCAAVHTACELLAGWLLRRGCEGLY
eukprot:SAG11_NODE_17585_length_514_cov_0.877108_1_plen_125_part_10